MNPKNPCRIFPESHHSEEPKHLQAGLGVGSDSGDSSYSSFSMYPQACVRGVHDRGRGTPVPRFSPAVVDAGNSGRTLRLFRNPPKGAMPC